MIQRQPTPGQTVNQAQVNDDSDEEMNVNASDDEIGDET